MITISDVYLTEMLRDNYFSPDNGSDNLIINLFFSSDNGSSHACWRTRHRSERLRRRSHPRRRRVACRIRRHLPEERHGVGSRATDLHDYG